MTSSQEQRQELTIGVELEFLYLTRADLDEIRKLDCREDYLSRFRRGVNDIEGQQAVAETIRNIPGVEVHTPLGSHGDYSRWSTTNDESLSVDEDLDDASFPIDCTGEGVELISPVFKYNSGKWKRDLRAVTKALDMQLNQRGSDTRLVVNHWCGLHVHIGRGTEDFPFDDAQRLLLLVTAFEFQIESLHSSVRLGNSFGYRAPGSIYRSKSKSGKLYDWLRQILMCKSFDELPDKRSAYNMRKDYYITGNPNTIEFRQHRGTLNPAEIEAWVHVVAAMVTYVEGCNVVYLFNFCTRNSLNPDWTALDFLDEIGVNRATMQFYADRFNNIPAPARPMERRLRSNNEQLDHANDLDRYVDAVEEETRLDDGLDAVALTQSRKMKKMEYGRLSGHELTMLLPSYSSAAEARPHRRFENQH